MADMVRRTVSPLLGFRLHAPVVSDQLRRSGIAADEQRIRLPGGPRACHNSASGYPGNQDERRIRQSGAHTAPAI
jgi:hypothetical protein